MNKLLLEFKNIDINITNLMRRGIKFSFLLIIFASIILLTYDFLFTYLKNGLTKGESLNTTKALVELEKCVNDIYPEFKHKLISICGVNITEYNVSLLLKSGFSPSEISKLLSKSNETISSIRRRLMKKVFNQKNASPKLWDEFISSL